MTKLDRLESNPWRCFAERKSAVAQGGILRAVSDPVRLAREEHRVDQAVFIRRLEPVLAAADPDPNRPTGERRSVATAWWRKRGR